MAVSGGVRRPLTFADSCHLKTTDLETSSGIMSVVLTANRIVVYIFCKQNSPLVRNTLEEGRQKLSFSSCLIGKFSAALGGLLSIAMIGEAFGWNR